MTNFDKPILITGCARSGTSLCSGILSISGVWMGKTIGGGRHNPRGFFENRKIKEDINKGILRKMGHDVLGQADLPKLSDLKKVIDLRSSVREILDSEGYTDQLWGFKDAKLTLIWPIWYDAFPDATWIIVRRNRDDIIKSCLATKFMSRRHTYEEWGEWVDEHMQRLDALRMVANNYYEVWPEKLFNGDYSEIKSLLEKLGLSYNHEKVKSFVIPDAWKSS